MKVGFTTWQKNRGFTIKRIEMKPALVIVGNNTPSSKPKIIVASATAKYPTTSVVVETNASSDSIR